jgi:type IV fimbrial biogenesis protein FimT
MNMRTSGFTLIELMIALSIFAFLIFLAGPMYADFMGNSQIRNAAENSLTGVRLAQAAAIKGNSRARFVLSTSGWAVYAWDDELGDFAVAPLQTYQFAEGASRTTYDPTPAGATRVTFDGLGRVVPDASSLTQIEVTNPSVTSPRKLRVMIGFTGVGGSSGIKLCDPVVLAPDPRSCPLP